MDAPFDATDREEAAVASDAVLAGFFERGYARLGCLLSPESIKAFQQQIEADVAQASGAPPPVAQHDSRQDYSLMGVATRSFPCFIAQK